MLHGQHTLLHSLSPPSLHLASVNPFIQTALDGTTAAHIGASAHAPGAPQSSWALPRVAGPLSKIMPAGGLGPERHACGVSAFAFQGTNAHVLLEAPRSSGQVCCLLV